MTTLLSRVRISTPIPSRPRGVAALLATEAFAAVIGFGVLIVMARTLGPVEFAAVESAAAVVAILLVLVRSGIEQIVIREAARRPRLIGPLTETLISLKLACAVLAYLMLATAAVGFQQRPVALIAGLILFPSALIADVGPRARGRFGLVAISQGLRAFGLLTATILLVKTSADALAAAGCLVIAETISALVLGYWHVREFGAPNLQIRWRAWIILGRRGLLASASRLGRVTIYGADLLVLAALSSEESGSYAASRRLVFAMVGLGLVLPAAFAPSIANAWSRGAEPAARAITAATFALMNIAIPAAIGLVMTAEGWMTRLFGGAYRGSGLALSIVAARAPILLAATLYQTSLVAIRREVASLQIVLIMLSVGIAAVPLSGWYAGPIGVGVSMVGVELLGAWLGWRKLRTLNVAPPILPIQTASVLGTLAMIATVLSFRHRPVWEASAAGAVAFGGVWLVREIGGRS